MSRMRMRTTNLRTLFMRAFRSFARVTRTSTRSRRFSTSATRSPSMQAPMVHTSRGKDFLEYDNPYNVGMTGILGGPAGYHAVRDCDVLLLLGADFAWSQYYPDQATIIQIDADPTHIGRRHPVAIGAVGDIKTTLQALL